MLSNDPMYMSGQLFKDPYAIVTPNGLPLSGTFSPMIQSNFNQNNLAGSSFYSHHSLPVQPSGGYMGTVNAHMPMIRTPMDQVGFGSFSMNFNRMQPTFYSDQTFQQSPMLTFRQQQQANYMPQMNSGVSKYQEFINQVNKNKGDM